VKKVNHRGTHLQQPCNTNKKRRELLFFINLKEFLQPLKMERKFKEGKILEDHPIKPHVPLPLLKRAKSIPFLCCQNTPEAECLP